MMLSRPDLASVPMSGSNLHFPRVFASFESHVMIVLVEI